MTEGQALLFQVALIGAAVVLWFAAGRIRRRIPWLNQPRPKRDAASFLFEERPVRPTPVAPAMALPVPPSAGQQHAAGPVDPAQATAQAVAALPEQVTWPSGAIKANHLPILHDGRHWYSLSLLASEHAVICGASRSGKGNLLQLIGLSALALGPDVAQVWFLDAKQGLDYSFAPMLAHARLYADVKDAHGGLTEGFDAALAEMTRRNNLLFNKARNVHEYCMKIGEQLPIIVLIVDEAAELDKDQKDKLCTLARMGAAAGLVLLTSTQYPTADVLSSQVQANALNRVCLKLSSSKQTDVALALAPGERSTYDPAAIVPRGVAVFRHNGGQQVLGRIPEVTDDLRDRVIDHLVKQWPRPVPAVSLVPGPKTEAFSGDFPGPGTTGTTGTNNGFPHQDAGPAGTNLLEVETKEDLVRALLLAGKTGNDIFRILGGNRGEMRELVKKTKQDLGLVDSA